MNVRPSTLALASCILLGGQDSLKIYDFAQPVRERVAVSTPDAKVRIERKLPTPTSGWIQDPEVSWYGPGFYGRRTACGHAYTTTILGVAHRSLPCGTRVEFRHRGITKEVPVIDRGPYVAGRTWDLSGGLCTLLKHCFTGPIEYRIIGR